MMEQSMFLVLGGISKPSPIFIYMNKPGRQSNNKVFTVPLDSVVSICLSLPPNSG